MWISATQINWMRDKRRKRVFESAGTIGNLAYLALSMDLIFAFFPSQGEPSMSSPLRICAALCAEACMNSPKSLLPTVSNSWSLMFKYDNIYTLTYIYIICLKHFMSLMVHRQQGARSTTSSSMFHYVPVCSSIDTCRTMKFLQIERSSTDDRRWTPPVLGNWVWSCEPPFPDVWTSQRLLKDHLR